MTASACGQTTEQGTGRPDDSANPSNVKRKRKGGSSSTDADMKTRGVGNKARVVSLDASRVPPRPSQRTLLLRER